MKKPETSAPFRTLSKHYVYENPWMKVREDRVITPGGTDGIYGVVEAKDGVLIIAVTAHREIVLLESYRYAQEAWRWELPTGGIEDGSSPLQAAKRELREEAGLVGTHWQLIGKIDSSFSGMLKDRQYVYLAEGLHGTVTAHEAGEAIRSIKAFHHEKVFGLVSSGALNDGQSLAALFYYLRWREKHPSSDVAHIQ